MAAGVGRKRLWGGDLLGSTRAGGGRCAPAAIGSEGAVVGGGGGSASASSQALAAALRPWCLRI